MTEGGVGLGLRPRPEIDPAVLVAIAMAVDKVWPRPVQSPEWRRGNDNWRFSGRWWNQRVSLRRERPTAGF
ncbi:MAG TPA: hypothetical protein VEJ44_04810 [Acidimicrobiales bacterium]|nr:hypothetical protein [Acidimicrobiales bacterium]